jgi:NADPH:quinone reductase-like Zn-dependent oxidoreductase
MCSCQSAYTGPRRHGRRGDALGLVVKGDIKPLIDSVRSLDEIAAARQSAEERNAMGKIVLTP